jgi:predicted secreted hydrolase
VRWPAIWLLGIATLALAAVYVLRTPAPVPSPAINGIDLGEVLGGEGEDIAGFARAERVRPFRFPEDHGPHPEFRSEWWYFTGNLYTERGRRFGYELTIFRFALSPYAPARASRWATNQVYLGHFAVTDVAGRRFQYFERLARGALGLAGAQAQPFKVWVEGWSIEAQQGADFPWRLRAAAEGITLDLAVSPLKPIVLHGEQGLSRRSAEPGRASYYYSIPRFDTHGTIELDGERFAVAGLSWLDREWSTSALAPDQAGWDWFALQLADGTELMFYRLRRRDGSTDPHSAGTLVDAEGRTTALARDDVAIETLATWESPRGGLYPARWRLTVQPADLVLEVSPVLADQELAVSPRYWEGAVDMHGTRQDKPIAGQGYVELTGYARRTQR